MRCDIYGNKGTCSLPLAVGDNCEKNADCEPGLVCNPDTGLCALPPAVTPTPTPLPTKAACGPGETLVGNVCVASQVSRSSGCSIGDPRGSSAGGAASWILALLPLALGIRRFGRQGARG
jgi:hypothetical protein